MKKSLRFAPVGVKQVPLAPNTPLSKTIFMDFCIVTVKVLNSYVENTFRIILYALWGIITLDILKQAIILVPFMLIGLILGMRSGKLLDEKLVKKLVVIMLIISGIALIYGGK